MHAVFTGQKRAAGRTTENRGNEGSGISKWRSFHPGEGIPGCRTLSFRVDRRRLSKHKTPSGRKYITFYGRLGTDWCTEEAVFPGGHGRIWLFGWPGKVGLGKGKAVPYCYSMTFPVVNAQSRASFTPVVGRGFRGRTNYLPGEGIGLFNPLTPMAPAAIDQGSK